MPVSPRIGISTRLNATAGKLEDLVWWHRLRKKLFGEAVLPDASSVARTGGLPHVDNIRVALETVYVNGIVHKAF